MGLDSLNEIFAQKPIVAIDEIAAYEYLWSLPKASVKTIADLFRNNEGKLPSEIVGSEKDVQDTRERLVRKIQSTGIEGFGLFINGTVDYPIGLRDAKNPVEMLYYLGDWGHLMSEKLIAIVGARKASPEGKRRTRKLVKLLVDNDYTIVSGLAEGIDTAAHEAAIEFGGKTIAVMGTPITEIYPKSNSELASVIAREHLIVSQVPVLKYSDQDWRSNRTFFPERNKTMSALTRASVIVEASETSGTLIQARAAFYQGRELFILASCFKNELINWPERFQIKGAHRVDDIQDILDVLERRT